MELIRVKDRLNEPRFIALLMLSMCQPTPERAAAKAVAYSGIAAQTPTPVG